LAVGEFHEVAITDSLGPDLFAAVSDPLTVAPGRQR
jgi:hypothetical protein